MSIDVGSAIAYLDLDISGFQTGFQTALSELDTFSTKTSSFSSTMTNIGSSLSNAGSKLTLGVTTPLVAAATAAVKTSADFESSMSKVEAISGSTADEMQALRDKALEMGASTKFSAKESADAFTYMAMAGWDAEQMMNGISGIMQLAAADGLDLATTSDIVTDALTAFGLQASDSGHFADVLAQASSSANTNVSMLGESFKYVAPVAGSLGLSVEDTAVALGLMANAGIKGSQSGTALRTALTNMVKPTDAMASKMEELGIEVTNADGTMKSLDEIMVILREKFGKLSEAEQANAAATIFGKEAMSGMLAVINTSNSDFEKLSNTIGDANGRAQEMADTMMNNLTGSITLLKSAIEGLMIQLGDKLSPIIRRVAEWITKIVEKLSNMDDAQFELIIKIGAVIAALGPLLTILGKVFTIIGSVSKGFAAISSAVGLCNPVLLAIVGVIALAAKGFMDLWKNSEEFREKIQKLFERLKNIWQKLKPALDALARIVAIVLVNAFSGLITIIETVVDVISDVFDWLGRLLNAIKEGNWAEIGKLILEGIFLGFKSAFKLVVGVVKGLFDFIWGTICDIFGIHSPAENMKPLGENILLGIIEGFKSMFGAMLEALKAFAQMVFDFFDGVWTSLSDFASNVWQSISELLGNIKQAIIDFVSESWNNIKEFFSNIVTNVKDFITDVKKRIKDFFSDIVQKIKDFITDVIQRIKDFFFDIVRRVKEFVSDIIQKIRDFFSNIIQSVRDFVADVIQKVKDFITDVTQRVKDFIADIIQKVKDFISDVVQKIKDFFSDIVQKVKDFVSDVTQKVKDFFSDIIQKVKDFISDIVQKIKDFFSDIVQKVKDFFSDIIQKVKDFFSDIVQKVKDFISDVIQKIEDFFSDIWQKVKDGMKNIYDSIKEKLEDVINFIKTLPSVFFELGKSLFSSLWDGIKSIWDLLWGWINEHFGWIIEKVQGVANAIGNIFGGVKNAVGGIVNTISGSHANGLDYVPFNGYVAELHQGERVLTKQEAKEYNDGNGGSRGGDTYIFEKVKDDPYEYARAMRNMKKEMLLN